jgi:hypothetical protein
MPCGPASGLLEHAARIHKNAKEPGPMERANMVMSYACPSRQRPVTRCRTPSVLHEI